MGVAGFLLCIVIGIVLPVGAFHCPLHQMGSFLCGLSPLSLLTVKFNTPDLGTGLNLNPSQWMTSLPTPQWCLRACLWSSQGLGPWRNAPVTLSMRSSSHKGRPTCFYTQQGTRQAFPGTCWFFSFLFVGFVFFISLFGGHTWSLGITPGSMLNKYS